MIIGPDWDRFRLWDRLLSRPDWVHFEIEHARQSRKPILPIVVRAASIPRMLPRGLRFPSTTQAASLRHDTWDADADQFVAMLRALAGTPVSVDLTPEASVPLPKRALVMAAAASAVLLLMLALCWRRASLDVPTHPGQTAWRSASHAPPTSGSVVVEEPDGDTLMSTNRVGLMSATNFVLTVKGISDPDGDALRYRWDFGDGPPAPPSAPQVEKVYERVNRFQVKLFVNDGSCRATSLRPRPTSPSATCPAPGSPISTAIPRRCTSCRHDTRSRSQQGNQPSGRILPVGSNRSTVLNGYVEHPATVHFGSESAWWNDGEDAYFDLRISDGNLAINMTNLTPGACGPSMACRAMRAYKQ